VRIIPNEPIIPDVVPKAAGLTLVDARKCYAHSSRPTRGWHNHWGFHPLLLLFNRFIIQRYMQNDVIAH